MLKQNQEAQIKINEIYESLQFIKKQSSAFIKQINHAKLELKKEKLLLLFGFQHNEVDGLYAHFQDKSVITENQYIKIVKLMQNQKVSYLINTSYSLESIIDSQLCLKQCVTRIILNSILLQFKDCYYHIIVNYQKLQGQTQQEKINQITDFGLFNQGAMVFKNQNFSILFENGEDLNYCLVKETKNNNQIFQSISKKDTLRLILSADKFEKIQNQKVQDYGPMTLFLTKTLENYADQLNIILRNYQNQLLYLQQIPTLEDEKELNNSIIQLIKKLNKSLQIVSNSNIGFTEDLFEQINIENQEQHKTLNSCLQKLNIKLIENFLNDKKITIEEMLIPDFLVKEQELELINQMLKKYITVEFDKKNVSEIKNLKINLKCWDSYCSQMVESIIYNFKQMILHIQEGPQEEREIGVFLFGKTRVGKSTLMNIVNNPESLTIEKRISELCYAIKPQYQTEFNIEHGCMSETQKISCIKIGDVWFYDCPGFDDNISQLKRIAHRMSLYNYLIKTKKVIGLFVIDSSNRDAQIIKDTIDPICLLLKDKNQIIKENNKWASLVLVKTKENTRKDYIEHWEEAYHGLLEGKYTFYREMYENDNQCIEFPKPKENLSSEQQQEQFLKQNVQIKQKILNRVNENKQYQNYQLNLQLYIEPELFCQYEIVLSMLQIKIQQIVELLENQITTYILDCEDELEEKKKLIEKFNEFIDKQINQQNVKSILTRILEWCQLNDKFNHNSIFLQRIIDDVLQCLKIDDYCKNTKISPIKVDTSILKNNAEKIISLIQLILKIEFGLFTGAIILSLSSLVVSISSILIANGLVGTAALIPISKGVIGKITLETSLCGNISSGINIITFYYRQSLLRWSYDSYLKEKKGNQ